MSIGNVSVLEQGRVAGYPPEVRKQHGHDGWIAQVEACKIRIQTVATLYSLPVKKHTGIVVIPVDRRSVGKPFTHPTLQSIGLQNLRLRYKSLETSIDQVTDLQATLRKPGNPKQTVTEL